MKLAIAVRIGAAALMMAAMSAPASAHGPIGTVGDAVCSATGGTGSQIGNTTCLLRATEIIYVTNWGPAGQAPLKRTQTLSLLNVPTPIDVDNRPGADLVATVKALGPGQVSLEVSKAPLASATLPVSIVAHANDPGDTSLRYVFGYDARASTAPGRFVKTFKPRSDGLGVQVTTSAAGTSLALLGSRIKSTQNVITGKREEALDEARVTFAPVPASIDGDLAGSEQSGGTSTTEAKLTVDRKSKVSVDFAQERSTVDSLAKREGTHTDLEGTLDQVDAATMPTRSATVKLVRSPLPLADPPDAKRTQVDTTTTGVRVARAHVTLTERDAADTTQIKSKTDAELENLPPTSTITIKPKEVADTIPGLPGDPPIVTRPAQPLVITVGNTQGQAFGLVDVARAERGEPQRLLPPSGLPPADHQYAYVLTDGTLRSAGARIRGLKEATVRVLEDELVDVNAKLDLTGAPAGGRPFKVVAEDKPNKIVKADISNLPGTVEFTLQPRRTPTIKYRGSSQISSVTVSAHDEAGLAKTEKPTLPGQKIVTIAEDLEVVATGVPTDLTASLDADAKKVFLTATDAVPGQTTPGNPADIGKLDVRLSTGALAGDDKLFVDGLSATDDGALVRDRTDRYVIFARITALHSATLELAQDPLHLKLEHGPTYTARPFHALIENHDIEVQPGGGPPPFVVRNSYTDARVKNVPAKTDLKLRKQSSPTVTYAGSAKIGSVNVRRHDDRGIAAGERTGELAKDFLLEVTDLPSGPITADIDPSGKNVELDARDASTCSDPADRTTCNVAEIGQVKAQLWTRPPNATDDKLPVGPDQAFVDKLDQMGSDGVFVRDVAGSPPGFGDPDRYVVYARLTGLKAAKVVLDQTSPDVLAETGVRRDVHLDIDNLSMPECKDGEDNDGDGQRDFPNDPECTSGLDDSETTVAGTRTREQIIATITNRPKCMRFALGKQRVGPSKCSSGIGNLTLPNPAPNAGATTILYESGDENGAAQPTNQIDVTAKGLKELKGKELILTLKGVPGRLEAVVVGQDQVDLGTLPTTDDLDLLEVRLRSGNVNPADVIPQSTDGVLIRKNKIGKSPPFPFDRDVIFARISNLRSAHLTAKPNLDPNRNDVVAQIDVNPIPGRGFVFDSEEDDLRGISTSPFIERITREIEASLDQLKPQMSLKVKVVDPTLPQEIHYTHQQGSGSAGKLVFDRKKVDSLGSVIDEKVHAEADPVPDRVDLCVAGSKAACNLDAFTGHPVANHPGKFTEGPHPTGPTIVFDASNPLTINFNGCLAPSASGSCNSPTSFLQLTNVMAQVLRLQISSMEVRQFCPPGSTPGVLCIWAPPGTSQPIDPQTNQPWFPVITPRMLMFVDSDNNQVTMGPHATDSSQGWGLHLKLISPPAKFEQLKGFLPQLDPKGRFTANDRRARIRNDLVPVVDQSYPGAPARDGPINCPDKMELFIDANFLGFIDADLKGLICP